MHTSRNTEEEGKKRQRRCFESHFMRFYLERIEAGETKHVRDQKRKPCDAFSPLSVRFQPTRPSRGGRATRCVRLRQIVHCVSELCAKGEHCGVCSAKANRPCLRVRTRTSAAGKRQEFAAGASGGRAFYVLDAVFAPFRSSRHIIDCLR